jgi:hypothetical protein
LLSLPYDQTDCMSLEADMREPGAPRDRRLPDTVISRIAMSCQRVRFLT